MTKSKRVAKYYWAYGSNLNVAQMKLRCPKAKVVGPFPLEDGALVFRGVADVEGRKGSVVPGGLWKITPECEAALDRYEGVAWKMYDKRYIVLKMPNGKVVDCLFYKMRSSGIMPPSEAYLSSIIQGYKDFGLDMSYLEQAVEHSWSKKNKTAVEKRRYMRWGQPSLARALEE